MSNSLRPIIFFISIFTIIACDDPEPEDDYYPLNERTQHYQEYMIFPVFKDDGTISRDTTKFQTADLRHRKDTLVEGRKYTIATYSEDRLHSRLLVRKQGSVVIARALDPYSPTFISDEFVLLDPTITAGASWIAKNSWITIEFTIMEKSATVSLFGSTFHNVLIVRERYDRGNGYELEGLRYYQKNTGEIYSTLPSPLSGRYGDVVSIIMK